MALSACAAGEAHRQREREMLTRRIVDDAIAYNEAYNDAITGQILLNILRAYNRQPRQYMSMSGFANSRPDVRSTTLGLDGLPLDELGERWGFGSLEVGEDTQLEPEYKVEPFSSSAYSNIALMPTPSVVFQYYWDNGWNRDLLLILLVDQIRVSGSESGVYANAAGTIARNCEGEIASSGGCAFIAQARGLARATRGLTPVLNGASDGACYPIASYDVSAVRALRGGDASCPVAIVVGNTTYTLRLRSLDDTIYYVGELLRIDRSAPARLAEGVLEARLQVIAPGSRDEMSPLFRVSPATAETERDYVATVSYAGRRYSAGAPANWFCYDARGPEFCQSPGADRSGTVLELLAGILAHNQSEAAVRAPQNTIVR
jgi:hypothetical protein